MDKFLSKTPLLFIKPEKVSEGPLARGSLRRCKEGLGCRCKKEINPRGITTITTRGAAIRRQVVIIMGSWSNSCKSAIDSIRVRGCSRHLKDRISPRHLSWASNKWLRSQLNLKIKQFTSPQTSSQRTRVQTSRHNQSRLKIHSLLMHILMINLLRMNISKLNQSSKQLNNPPLLLRKLNQLVGRLKLEET